MTANQQLAGWSRQAPASAGDSAAAVAAQRAYIGDPFRMVISRFDRWPIERERKCKRDLLGNRTGRLAWPESKARAHVARVRALDKELDAEIARMTPGEFNAMIERMVAL